LREVPGITATMPPSSGNLGSVNRVSCRSAKPAAFRCAATFCAAAVQLPVATDVSISTSSR
jgi:hypothetical protein